MKFLYQLTCLANKLKIFKNKRNNQFLVTKKSNLIILEEFSIADLPILDTPTFALGILEKTQHNFR